VCAASVVCLLKVREFFYLLAFTAMSKFLHNRFPVLC
jgi:hypothetical protein